MIMLGEFVTRKHTSQRHNQKLRFFKNPLEANIDPPGLCLNS